MPLFSHPVVLPYRYDGDADDQFHIGQAHALATTQPAALATAQVLITVQAILRAPGRRPLPAAARARVGAAGMAVEGLYAYVIARNGPIQHLHFPSRLDQDQGARMGDVLNGLDADNIFGLVFDCNQLTYLNSMALASIAGHAERLHIHCCRLSDPVRKVFELVSLHLVVGVHKDLQTALAALVQEYRAKPQT